MSAKHPKKGAKPSPAHPSPAAPASAASTPATPASAAAAATAGTAVTDAGTFTPWIDSSDPRKRTLGKIILAGVWVYVGALCLLALDQTFNWGIFGPKLPPLP